MVNSDELEFVNTIDCVWLLPSTTLPKLTLAGLTLKRVPSQVLESEKAATGNVKLQSVKRMERRRKERMPRRRKTNLCTVPPCCALLRSTERGDSTATTSALAHRRTEEAADWSAAEPMLPVLTRSWQITKDHSPPVHLALSQANTSLAHEENLRLGHAASRTFDEAPEKLWVHEVKNAARGNLRGRYGMTAWTSLEYELSLAEVSTAVTT